MSDELLKALGRAGREEAAAADAASKQAPALDGAARERMVEAALGELPARRPQRSFPVRRVAIAGVLALAAAIVALFSLRRSELPPYALSLAGGTSEWRGEDAARGDRVVVRADGAIEILVRPAVPVNWPVQARAFAVHDAQEASEKILPVEVSPQGVVRVAGRADELLGPPGPRPAEWRITVVIGRAGAVPAALAASRGRDDLRRLEATVVVSASEP